MYSRYADSVRDLYETKLEAPTPEEQDREKVKITRYGGLIGELFSAMKRFGSKLGQAVTQTASFAKKIEQIAALWKKLEPWLGWMFKGGG